MLHRLGLTLIAFLAAIAMVPSFGMLGLDAQEDETVQHRKAGDPERARRWAEAAVRGLDYVPGEVVVKFREGVSLDTGQRVLRLALRRERPGTPHAIGDAYLVPLEGDGDDPARAAMVLNTQPEVEYAEPNRLYRLRAAPNDTYYTSQWNFGALDMERAWAINPGGAESVTVAVIDTGMAFKTITYGFRYWNGRVFVPVSIPFREADDLIRDGRIVSPHDYFWEDEEPVDMQVHGTHVAGTVGQLTNNGRGAAGIAYNVKLMPLKVCISQWDIQFLWGELGIQEFAPYLSGVCSTAAGAEAIRFAADQGARVINLSLGGAEPSTLYADALRYAVGKGVFVAAAMGNEYEEGNPVDYPAAYAKDIDGMVSVGAVGRSLVRAWYSNTGPHLELMAPGGDTRQSGSSGAILQQTLLDEYFDWPPELLMVPRFDMLGYPTYYQGTSMATPHVAGVAALLINQGITTPAAVESALKRTARDLGTPGFDEQYGYGLIQPRTALRGLGLAR